MRGRGWGAEEKEVGKERVGSGICEKAKCLAIWEWA